MTDDAIDIRDTRPPPDETCTCLWSVNSEGHGYVYMAMNDCPARPHARMK